MEIQSGTTTSLFVTPQSYHRRFHDLQRHFNPGALNGGGDDEEGGGDADSDPPPYIPWLKDLRRLRIAELRREVDHYDLSIRWKVYNRRSVRGETNSSDKQKKEAEKEGCSPESLAGDRISSGDGSGPSVEHSNSTDTKQKSSESGPSPG